VNLSDPLAALEIGTSHTVVAIGEPLGDGRIKIVAVSDIPSSGVRKSQIIDVSQARYSVDSVLKRLEDQSGYSIGESWLVVSGPHIHVMPVTAQWSVDGGVVHEEDIVQVDNKSFDSPLPENRVALELQPICYGLDDIDNIASPLGMTGHLLKERSLYIHGSAPRIADARNAARGAKLEIRELGFAGICAATAVLTPQQKRDGALVIDLGGGSTTYTVWSAGHLMQAGIIGVGGDHITSDIQIAFSVPIAQAEQLKTSSAAATIAPEDATVRIPIPAQLPSFKTATISRRALNTVVNARMQELFTIIRTKLDEENLLHLLNAGIFLTGGGTALSRVNDLATSIFGRPVRTGTLIPEIEGLADHPHPAALATITGLLLAALQDSQPRKFSLSNMFKSLFGAKS